MRRLGLVVVLICVVLLIGVKIEKGKGFEGYLLPQLITSLSELPMYQYGISVNKKLSKESLTIFLQQNTNYSDKLKKYLLYCRVFSNIEFNVKMDYCDRLRPKVSSIEFNSTLDEYSGFSEELLREISLILTENLNKLFARNNFLNLNEELPSFRIVFDSPTFFASDTLFLGKCKYTPLSSEHTMHLHPYVLINPILLEFSMRNLLDHMFFKYLEIENDAKLEHEQLRIAVNDAHWIRMLPQVEKRQLEILLTGGNSLFDISKNIFPHIKEALNGSQIFFLQNNKDQRIGKYQFVGRILHEDAPFIIKLGEKSKRDEAYYLHITKVKSGQNPCVIFLLAREEITRFDRSLVLENKEIVELAIEREGIFNIGRGSKTAGFVRVGDKDGNSSLVGTTMNKNDIEIMNRKISRMHLQIVISDLESEETKILIMDRGSQNGNTIVGPWTGYVAPEVKEWTEDPFEDLMEKEQYDWQQFEIPMRECIKDINWRINPLTDNWEEKLCKEYREACIQFRPKEAGLLQRLFDYRYNEIYLQRWQQAISDFSRYILFLRNYHVNFILRLSSDSIDEKNYVLIEKTVRKLGRIPYGLLSKMKHPDALVPYFPYVFEEEQEGMIDWKGAVRLGECNGTIAIHNGEFKGSNTFLFSSDDGFKGFYSEEEVDKLEVDRIIAHENLHALHLLGNQLSGEHFAQMLDLTRKKYIDMKHVDLAYSLITKTIDLSDLIRERISRYKDKSKEVFDYVRKVCNYFRLPVVYTLFYGPAEAVTFPLTREPEVLKEIDEETVEQICAIAKQDFLRSHEPVGIMNIQGKEQKIYEVYEFINDRWHVKYGNAQGKIFQENGQELLPETRAITNIGIDFFDLDTKDEFISYVFGTCAVEIADSFTNEDLAFYSKYLIVLLFDKSLSSKEGVHFISEENLRIININRHFNNVLYKNGIQPTWKARLEFVRRLMNVKQCTHYFLKQTKFSDSVNIKSLLASQVCFTSV